MCVMAAVRAEGFNTQPPEGGWSSLQAVSAVSACFNTQPPEGGWHRYKLFPQ